MAGMTTPPETPNPSDDDRDVLRLRPWEVAALIAVGLLMIAAACLSTAYGNPLVP